MRRGFRAWLGCLLHDHDYERTAQGYECLRCGRFEPYEGWS